MRVWGWGVVFSLCFFFSFYVSWVAQPRRKLRRPIKNENNPTISDREPAATSHTAGKLRPSHPRALAPAAAPQCAPPLSFRKQSPRAGGGVGPGPAHSVSLPRPSPAARSLGRVALRPEERVGPRLEVGGRAEGRGRGFLRQDVSDGEGGATAAGGQRRRVCFPGRTGLLGGAGPGPGGS